MNPLTNYALLTSLNKPFGFVIYMGKYGMGFSRKKTNRVEDMEFRGVLKKKQVDFPGLSKNNAEYPGVVKKKSCGISRGPGFRP